MKLSKVKNWILSAIILAATFSCTKNDAEDSNNENNQNSTEIKDVSVNIELPNGTSFTANSLKVSTILTDESVVTNSSAKVSTFNDNATELTFATNSSGNMVLLGYFNPKNTENVILNTETTAAALIMFHPWTMDLSVEGKEDAIAQIKKMSEFTSFKNSVESSIKTGNLDPLSTTEIVNKIATIQKKITARLSVNKEPLYFDIDVSKITITNQNSSAAYSAAIYDSNNKMVSKNQLVEGLTKFQATMNLVPEIKFAITPAPPTTFTTPTANGDYTIIAKSGLSFDSSEENAQARDKNIDIWFGNMVGIFSTKLKAIYRFNFGACGGEIASLVIKSTKMYEDLKSYSEKKTSNYIFIKSFLEFSLTKYGEIVGIINHCSTNHKVKLKPFKLLLEKLEILSRLESVYNGSAHLTDWVQYDKEIKICFNKNGNEVNACNLLDGIWKMDFTLAPLDQNCDENLFEDEAGIPPTFHFNPNGTFTFDSCEVDDLARLNNPAFYTNTYTFENNILKIKSRYVESSNGVESIFITEATLTYESNTKSFNGSHTFKSWENGAISYNCANTIKIYK